MVSDELRTKLEAAGDLRAQVDLTHGAGGYGDRFKVKWHDYSIMVEVGQTKKGLYLGSSPGLPWDETSDLVEKFTGRRPQRRTETTAAKPRDKFADYIARLRTDANDPGPRVPVARRASISPSLHAELYARYGLAGKNTDLQPTEDYEQLLLKFAKIVSAMYFGRKPWTISTPFVPASGFLQLCQAFSVEVEVVFPLLASVA
jgi:hypothetical protein